MLTKATKIRINRTGGLLLTCGLLWIIWLQVRNQTLKLPSEAVFSTDKIGWFFLALLLLPANLGLESLKWKILAAPNIRIGAGRSLQSVLCGIATSIITPNRIGEYPGRLLFLGLPRGLRLITASLMGMASQLFALCLFGLVGLVYYNLRFPSLQARIALGAALGLSALLLLVYARIEHWIPALMAKYRHERLRKFGIYARLLQRRPIQQHLTVISLSLLRFLVFTAQYLAFLAWFHVQMPLADGFFLASLFFYGMAVIPTFALTEFSERGVLSLFLFQHVSDNSLGILAATFGLWALNLIMPALAGALLLMRLRLLR